MARRAAAYAPALAAAAVVLVSGQAMSILSFVVPSPSAPDAGALTFPSLRGQAATVAPRESASASPAIAAVGAFAIAAVWAAAQRSRVSRRANFAGSQESLTLRPSTTTTAVAREARKKNKKMDSKMYKATPGGLESDAEVVSALGEAQSSYQSSSFLGSLEAEELEEDAEARKVEEELAEEEELFADDAVDQASAGFEEESEEELARKGARQVTYNLYPSRQYVLYIAKKNAERNWTKDGPGGKNKGCLEVQIAIMTERIRSMVLHMKENTHDYKCRMKLVSLVARRRAYLDKLSWKNLDAYLKIRDALKIRHVYRMEALIGRLGQYKYPNKDRKIAPGRKVAMRLKKKARLLERRLASQLRQGRPRRIIHKTKRAIRSRNWLSRPYDDVEAMRKGKSSAGTYINPLKLP